MTNITNIYIAEGADITGSSIGNTFRNKSLDELFIESINEVRDFINGDDDDSRRRHFLSTLQSIESYFVNNEELLTKVLDQINCKIEKSNESKKISIVKMINFFLLAFYTDNNCELPNQSTSYTKTNKKRNWLFNLAISNEESKEKHISKIADYIFSNADANLKNGVCFISMLLDNGGLECRNCTTGLLYTRNPLSKIFPDWLKGQTSSEKDFFELNDKCSLDLKCGTCVTNIRKGENAKRILRG